MSQLNLPGRIDDFDIKGTISAGNHSELLMACLKKSSINADSNNNINVNLAKDTGRSSSSTTTANNQGKSGSGNNANGDDQFFAIKRVNLSSTNLRLENIIKETNAMIQLKHQNVIDYYRAFFGESDVYIVMELCNGSIHDILRYRYCSLTGKKPMPIMKAKELASVLRQTLNGLQYIHNDGIIHRDIKAANVLFTRQGVIKIADFGVSGKMNTSIADREVRSTFVGTPSYISPEVIMGHEYDQKADIWSLGIMCIEMASGITPYSDSKPIKILKDILGKEPPSLETCAISKDQFKKYPKSFHKFIQCCLIKEAPKRLACDALMKQEFITNCAKGPSYIVSSLLLGNKIDFLDQKLDSQAFIEEFVYPASDDEDSSDGQQQQQKTNELKKRSSTGSLNQNRNADAKQLSNGENDAPKEGMPLSVEKTSETPSAVTTAAAAPSSPENQNKPQQNGNSHSNNNTNATDSEKRHILLRIRSLTEGIIKRVDFDVKVTDDWTVWANDMVESNLIKKESAQSMADALRFIIENDIDEITFKLDKNMDAALLDKENLIGFVQLKTIRDKPPQQDQQQLQQQQ